MEKFIIEFFILLFCAIVGFVSLRWLFQPLKILFLFIIDRFLAWYRLLSPVEKQQLALETAKQNLRVAELQEQTILIEKKAMRIQNRIIDEEFNFEKDCEEDLRVQNHQS